MNNHCPDSCRGIALDHCPVCGRHIRDYDTTGLEGDDAQRWCVAHVPDDHPQAHLRNN